MASGGEHRLQSDDKGGKGTLDGAFLWLRMLDPVPHATNLEFDLLYGESVRILFECGRGKFSIASAHAWLLPPILLDQILIHRDARGRAIGFMTWAHVNSATLSRLRDDKVSFLELPEWNEGEHLWITDIVAPAGGVRVLARRLRQRLHPSIRDVYGLRVDRPWRSKQLIRSSISKH